MDLDAYIAAIKDCRANVVLLNVGGIASLYPGDDHGNTLDGHSPISTPTQPRP
jgi:hypothetical protein